jgi:hypothetical protein
VQNIVPASLGPFPKINPEFVVRANPDVIMVGDYNYVGMAQRPGWAACVPCAKSASACSTATRLTCWCARARAWLKARA